MTNHITQADAVALAPNLQGAYGPEAIHALCNAAIQWDRDQHKPSFDECVASGQSCEYGPLGRKGEMQCKYCGKPQESDASKHGGNLVTPGGGYPFDHNGTHTAELKALAIMLRKTDGPVTFSAKKAALADAIDAGVSELDRRKPVGCGNTPYDEGPFSIASKPGELPPLPESVGYAFYISNSDSPSMEAHIYRDDLVKDGEKLHTADQLQAYGQQCVEQMKERAAKVCEQMLQTGTSEEQRNTSYLLMNTIKRLK